MTIFSAEEIVNVQCSVFSVQCSIVICHSALRYGATIFVIGEIAMKLLFPALLFVSFCVLVSCTASDDSRDGGDPLTGTWVGDFGPAFYDRNTSSLELQWDGKELTGMIRPGVQGGRMYRNFPAFPIENASFDPQTGAVKFEATYKPRGRHYIIEATLKGKTLSGTWNRPDEKRDGDFKLTRKAAP
jgi:hypothetical protein